MIHSWRFVSLMLFALLAAASQDATRAADWPTFRGADRTAVSKETGLLEAWPEEGPPLAWQIEGTGRGYSSLAIVGERIYLLGDNIAELAQKNEWAGVLIFGCIRDSEAVSALKVGVVALGTNPRKSAKRNEGTINVAVHFAGIRFIPGHTVYIDEDGIVTSETELSLRK